MDGWAIKQVTAGLAEWVTFLENPWKTHWLNECISIACLGGKWLS